jgi:F-type H+-transporting ATPase subunit epsilon
VTDEQLPERVNLLVVTPERIVFNGAVRWAQVPLHDGLLGVWPGHAPLIALLQPGDLVLDDGTEERSIPIPGGILRIDIERCVVLAGGLSEAARSKQEGGREHLIADMEEALQETLTEEELNAIQSP